MANQPNLPAQPYQEFLESNNESPESEACRYRRWRTGLGPLSGRWRRFGRFRPRFGRRWRWLRRYSPAFAGAPFGAPADDGSAGQDQQDQNDSTGDQEFMSETSEALTAESQP